MQRTACLLDTTRSEGNISSSCDEHGQY